MDEGKGGRRGRERRGGKEGEGRDNKPPQISKTWMRLCLSSLAACYASTHYLHTII